MIRPQKIYVKSHSFQMSALFDFAYSSQWETKKKKKITFFCFVLQLLIVVQYHLQLESSLPGTGGRGGGGEWGIV